MVRRLPSASAVVAELRHRIPWLAPPQQHGSPLPYVPRRPTVNPILPVTDMDAAVAFYEHLGFEVSRYDAGYAWVRTCGWEFVHLGLAAEMEPGTSSAGAFVHVDDADAWHVAMSAAAGDDSVGALADQPWGMREFSVRDPDGNVVRFGANR